MNNLPINIPNNLRITQEQFSLLAAANRDLQLELTSTGELIIMPPTGGNTGRLNLEIEGQIWWWNRQIQARWDRLTPAEQETFPPLCPDFAIELRSRSDRIENLRQKMQEYLENGLRLGWLIDFKNKTVEIYRSKQAVEVLNNPKTLSGEDILPGFILDLEKVFS